MNAKTPPASFSMSRRGALGGLALACAPLMGAKAWAAAPAPDAPPMALPLALQQICGHIGISVRDVEKSALFYSRLFGGENVNGEKEPFLRYFITLGAGGSVAIGKIGTLGSQGKTTPLIDHYCVGAKPYNDAAWRARLKAEGLAYIAQGVFLDPEGIAVQVAGGEGGESLSAGEVQKLPTLYAGAPLVRARGYDHIMLHVRDLQKQTAFYEKIFGLKVSERRKGIVFFSGETRLGLTQAPAGEAPGVHHYAVKVPAFDRAKLSDGLRGIGATILPIGEENKKALRFSDPDGLVVEFWPV